MRVLHLCPLWLPISRSAPGGIETLLASLVEALEPLGCSSTLLASGDSDAACTIVPSVDRNLCALMDAGAAGEYVYFEQQQMVQALELAPNFDLIHSHAGPGAFVLSALPQLKGRVLHTVHTPVTADLLSFAQQHPEYRFSTVSEYQHARLRTAGVQHCRTIHNGIDFDRFRFSAQGEGGLLFLGRMETSKGADLAIATARQLGLPLVLAGPIVERDFFASSIEPQLDQQIRYAGVVDHEQKTVLFGAADCVVLPFRGEESFGLVAIEAMACGTPVVAIKRGALAELIDPGSTGFLAGRPEQLGALVQQARGLERATVRTQASRRFDIRRTAEAYRDLYAELIGQQVAA